MDRLRRRARPAHPRDHRRGALRDDRSDIHFGLVLNLHQPAGNLDDLLETTEWDAGEILWAIDRIPRTLWDYEDVGRVHLALSGTLLETLADPRFQERAYGIVDCGSLLWHPQNTRTIEILGSASYHPVLPLIPPADRNEQIARWLPACRNDPQRLRATWPQVGIRRPRL